MSTNAERDDLPEIVQHPKMPHLGTNFRDFSPKVVSRVRPHENEDSPTGEAGVTDEDPKVSSVMESAVFSEKDSSNEENPQNPLSPSTPEPPSTPPAPAVKEP